MMHGGDDTRGFDTDVTHLDNLVEAEGAAIDKQIGAMGGGRWWDKLILKDKRFFLAANREVQRRERLALEEKELERPNVNENGSLAVLSMYMSGTTMKNGGQATSNRPET